MSARHQPDQLPAPTTPDPVRELVDAAPGLTDEQSRHLAVLLLRATTTTRQDTAA